MWKQKREYIELMKRRASQEEPEMQQFYKLLDFLESIYEPQMKFLDIGCSAGHLVNTLEKLDKNIKYTGIDYNEEFLEHAESIFQNRNNIQFVLGDALNLPFESQSFEIVIAYNLFHHFNDFRTLLDEIFRVCDKFAFIKVLLAQDTYLIRRISKDMNSNEIEVNQNFFAYDDFVDYLKSKSPKDIVVLDESLEISENNIAGGTRTVNGIQISDILLMNWKVFRIEIS